MQLALWGRLLLVARVVRKAELKPVVIGFNSFPEMARYSGAIIIVRRMRYARFAGGARRVEGFMTRQARFTRCISGSRGGKLIMAVCPLGAGNVYPFFI